MYKNLKLIQKKELFKKTPSFKHSYNFFFNLIIIYRLKFQKRKKFTIKKLFSITLCNTIFGSELLMRFFTKLDKKHFNGVDYFFLIVLLKNASLLIIELLRNALRNYVLICYQKSVQNSPFNWGHCNSVVLLVKS